MTDAGPGSFPGQSPDALARAVLEGEALRELAARGAWDELLRRYTELAAQWCTGFDRPPPDHRAPDALRQLIALHEELIGRTMRARADCMAELAALGRGGCAQRAYETVESGER